VSPPQMLEADQAVRQLHESGVVPESQLADTVWSSKYKSLLTTTTVGIFGLQVALAVIVPPFETAMQPEPSVLGETPS